MDLEPFKLLRDGNWVLNLMMLMIMVPAAFISPGSLSIGIIIIPLSSFLLWNALFGAGHYGVHDNLLIGKSLTERLKLGLMWI